MTSYYAAQFGIALSVIDFDSSVLEVTDSTNTATEDGVQHSLVSRKQSSVLSDTMLIDSHDAKAIVMTAKS